MRRRRLLLAAAVVPFAVGAIAYGCSSPNNFEDMCGWLGDPENCWAEFYADMKVSAGPANLENPLGTCATPRVNSDAGVGPTAASATDAGISNGNFQTRSMLTTCILSGGGTVTVSPGIDLTNYPPSLYAAPVTYTFTFTDSDSTVCGMATYSSPHGFSITINPPAGLGLTDVMDAAADAQTGSFTLDASAEDFWDGGPFINSGTFTQVNTPGQDAVQVVCPSGESHNFTLDQINVDNPANGECPQYANIVPTASVGVYLGGIDTPGALSFSITYPPLDPTLASETAYAGGTVNGSTVVYFNCAIPPAPEQCTDGVQDGTETDVDCGGPQNSSSMYCGCCPQRCGPAQQCLCDADCDQSGGLVCAVDPMSGSRVCTPTDMLERDAGEHGFGLCGWQVDAGAPCDKDASAATCAQIGAGGGGAGGGGAGGDGAGGGAGGAGGGGASGVSGASSSSSSSSGGDAG